MRFLVIGWDGFVSMYLISLFFCNETLSNRVNEKNQLLVSKLISELDELLGEAKNQITSEILFSLIKANP